MGPIDFQKPKWYAERRYPGGGFGLSWHMSKAWFDKLYYGHPTDQKLSGLNPSQPI